MRFAVILLMLSCLVLGAGLHAEEKPQHVISRFDSAEEMAKWGGGDSGNIELSVEPRTPTDKNKMLKMVCLGGAYPGIVTTPPPDWSPYEVFSFVVWSPSTYSVNIRIDDVHSRNYATRYNHGIKVEKGRTLVQIPIKDIGKAIDVSKVKRLILFTSSPPKGFTLWFDDIMLGPVQTEQVAFIPYEARMDIIPSMEVVTPHLPMAKNLSGGPLRTFMVAGAENGRESVEVLQRIDMDLSLLTWDRNWRRDTWGFGDFYGDRTQDRNFVLLAKYLASSMQGPEKFEAMILPTPLGWNRFSKGARESIVDRVRNRGEGLVLVFPYTGEADWEWPEDLRGLSALVDSESDSMSSGGTMRFAGNGRLFDRKWRTTRDHPITRGVPLEALPFGNMEVQKYDVADGAEVLIETDKGEPVLAVRTVGKGRVATFAVRSNMITPFFNIPRDISNPTDCRYWEVSYSLLARAAMWAANREFRREGEPATLEAAGDNADECLAVTQWRDAAGKVTDWALVYTPKPKPLEMQITAPEAVNPGEEIRVSFTIPPEYRDWKCVVALYEKAHGRIRTLERMDSEAAGLKREGDTYSANLPTKRMRRYVAYVKVTCGGQGVLAEGTAEVIVTPPPVWDDYEIYTWLDYGLPFLRDFEEQRMREFGLTGNLIGARDHRNMKRQLKAGLRVVAYGFTQGMHIGNYSEIVRQFQLTGDRKYLAREPSYSNDAFLAGERAKVLSTCGQLVPYAPISMIMSDETSLTSYRNEFDFDFHPGNIGKFRTKMKVKFGNIEALNEALGTAAGSFETLEPPTTEEARKAGNFGLWNEWRAHNDDQWALAFKFYGDTMKEKYRHARLSVSGTQTSHIFNGIDWGRMTRYFDAMSDYGGRFQLRKRLSFHPTGLKSTPWVGYGRSGRAVDHQLWTNLSFDGDGAAIFWWYSLRNPDLTWCRSGKDYMRVFKELRAGIGKQFQLTRRQFSPVAVCWSANSQRAAWTQGKYAEFEKAEADAVNTLVAAGFDPFFITEEEIAGGGLLERGAKALVLPMTVSMGMGGKKGGMDVLSAVRRFMELRGVVLATHDVRYDEFLQEAGTPEDVSEKTVKFTTDAGQLSSILGAKGVSPYVDIKAAGGGGRAKNVSVSVHAFPANDSARIILLLRAPVGMKEEVGADGVIYMVPDPEGGGEVERIEVDVSAFGGARFYDVRRGREIRATDGKLVIDMQAGDGLPIAAIDYGPVKFDSDGTSVATKDRMMNIRWRLVGSGNAGLAQHAVRIDVIDGATGEPDPALSLNAVSGSSGSGSVDIPLALEDDGRNFIVRIRDILTGTVWEHPRDVETTRPQPEGGTGKTGGDAAGPVPGAPEGAEAAPADTDEKPGAPTGDNAMLIAVGVGVLIVIIALVVVAGSRSGKRRRRNQR